MKAWILSIAMVVVLTVAADAQAQCCAKDKQNTAGVTAAKTVADEGGAGKTCTKTCDKSQMAKAGCDKTALAKDGSCDKSKCDKALAGAGCCGMPCMMFKVGDETTCCPKTAETLAADKSAKILYVVGEKEFTDKAEALTAYADALDAHFTKFTTVRYVVGDKCVECPQEAGELAKSGGATMKYCVAGTMFDSKDKADQAATQAQKSAQEIQMTTLVDGKPYTCEHSAATACEKSGKKAEYAVGSSCKTECKTTARIELAKARIDAARQAVAKLADVASAAQP